MIKENPKGKKRQRGEKYLARIGIRMGLDKYRLKWKEFEENTKAGV